MKSKIAMITQIPIHVRWLLVIAWMTVIFCFSAVPNSAEVTSHVFGGGNFAVRKCAHATEFSILFFLLRFALLSTKVPKLGDSDHRNPWGVNRQTVLAFIMTVLYAMSDEWHQSFVPARSADPMDVLLDSCGAAFFWIVLAVAYAFSSKRARRAVDADIS